MNATQWRQGWCAFLAPMSHARTKAVPSGARGLSAGLAGVLLWFAGYAVADGISAAAGALGAQNQRAAEGWLRLEQDQRAARQRLPRSSPRESAQQRAFDQQQDLDYRATLLEQRRDLQTLQREQRIRNSVPPAGSANARFQIQSMQQSRALQQQRINRGYGPGFR